jgi:type-F conjugative transfer system pilin assembly protein TrbC
MKNKIFLLLIIFFTAFKAHSYEAEALNIMSNIKNNEDYKHYENSNKELINNFENSLNSKEYKKNLNFARKEKNRIDQELQQEKYQVQIDNLIPNLNLSDFKSKEKLKSKKNQNSLLIFISSSIPKASLIRYSNDINKVGGVLALRGLIDNSFKKTVSFIYELNKNGTRAIIDPNSFKKFNIDHVPQILLISDNNCQELECNITPLHDRISGNVTLKYALEKISKDGEFTKEKAKKLLKNL